MNFSKIYIFLIFLKTPFLPDLSTILIQNLLESEKDIKAARVLTFLPIHTIQVGNPLKSKIYINSIPLFRLSLSWESWLRPKVVWTIL